MRLTVSPLFFFNVRATPCENNQHILLPAKWKADLMCRKIQTASFRGESRGDVEGLWGTFWCGESEGFGPVVAQSSGRNSGLHLYICIYVCTCRQFSVNNCTRGHLLRNLREKKKSPILSGANIVWPRLLRFISIKHVAALGAILIVAHW